VCGVCVGLLGNRTGTTLELMLGSVFRYRARTVVGSLLELHLAGARTVHPPVKGHIMLRLAWLVTDTAHHLQGLCNCDVVMAPDQEAASRPPVNNLKVLVLSGVPM
jgi:hypothetical protein